MSKTDRRQGGTSIPNSTSLGALEPGRPLQYLLAITTIVAVLVLTGSFRPSIAFASNTIWSSSTVPANVDSGDGHPLELGVRFQSDVAGYITGIRFYKASTNTGTHLGYLWSNTGTLLASATFTSETASGWQQVTFASPVSIAANTSYVASYYAPNGHYSLNRPYFTSSYDNAPLHALASGTDGANGIYYSPGTGFPTGTYQQTNYWVDVVFSSTGDADPTIWSNSTVPSTVDAGDGASLELGVRFQSDVPGSITGIRFYKASANTGTHVGHLWTNSGTLLASATFSGETASGWQQATFAAPVSIAANTTYVASYYAPNGHYSLDRPYFTATYNNSPLHALASGTDGPNGIYFYPGTGFPNSTYQQSNYWVDVSFSASSSGSGSSSTPSVSSVSPTSGPTTGGTAVTINGTNFLSGASVSFGGANSTAVSFISTTQINALTPAGSAGTVGVTVSNPGGLSASLPSAFTYTTTSGSGGSSGSGVGTSGQGLLSGMTASNFTLPSGWTLVEAVGFEDGTRGPGASSYNMAVACGFAHTGNCAIKGTYNQGDITVSWMSQPLGNSRDTYISFWEYDDPQGRMNADLDIGGIQVFGVTDAMVRFQPGCGGNALSNLLGIPYAWNAATQRPILYVEGLGGNPNFATWGWGDECLSPNAPTWGNWTQWEIRIKENDPTSPSSPANGEVELYQNGALVNQVPQYQGQCSSNPVPCSNLAGNLDIASLVHIATVGGVYTKYVEYQDAGLTVCSVFPNLPSYGTIMQNFANPDPCPNQAPPNGYVPTFNRYFDDIIVLKR